MTEEEGTQTAGTIPGTHSGGSPTEEPAPEHKEEEQTNTTITQGAQTKKIFFAIL